MIKNGRKNPTQKSANVLAGGDAAAADDVIDSKNSIVCFLCVDT